MNASARCVVLVPVGGPVDPGCEEGLRALEGRGYPVRRVLGYSAIDAARCQMATDALADGFDELMWIDADVVFDPADVDKLRGHGCPFTCGLYPKKGPRQFACGFLPGTAAVRFGRHGGLTDITYCGFGFTHTRREVYDAVRTRLGLEECNRGFRHPLVPYFAPMVGADGRGEPWYLHEDFAFCERARRCGFVVRADTTIRLWHVGSYRYGWEDAGRDVVRYADYTFHLPGPIAGESAASVVPATAGATGDWFAAHVPVWAELLGRLAGTECHALGIGVFEGRSTVWLLERVLTHPAATLTYVDTLSGTAENAGGDLRGLEGRFLANTAAHRRKLIGRTGRSEDVLRELPRGRYDFVSIDGSHEAADVLADAVLSWPLVKPGGLVCFDDYGWWIDPAPERSPKLAVDAFLAVMRGRCEVVRKGYQVWVRKPVGVGP
jgi:predicted O-methyltransferase YrrM